MSVATALQICCLIWGGVKVHELQFFICSRDMLWQCAECALAGTPQFPHEENQIRSRLRLSWAGALPTMLPFQCSELISALRVEMALHVSFESRDGFAAVRLFAVQQPSTAVPIMHAIRWHVLNSLTRSTSASNRKSCGFMPGIWQGHMPCMAACH